MASSRVRRQINDTYIREVIGISAITENSVLITIDRTEIIDNKIILQHKGYGDVVFDSALLFDNLDDDIISMECTCSLSPDGFTVNFEEGDNLNGKYAILTYLARAMA